MKFKTSEIIFYILVILSLFSFTLPTTGNLVINLDNVKTTDGMIWLALYDSKETLFDKEKAILKGVKIETTGTMEITFDKIPIGKYALAIFHDQNNNGELDKNTFGIPTEPYAFAGQVKSKWRAPRWNELCFKFSEPGQKINTKLSTWWD